MRLSEYFLPTLRETPAEADTISQKLMLRAGMMRKLASGIYEWLPLGLRVLKKVEQIVREEMDKVGGQEVLLPILLPRELWEETGRWSLYGKELMRLKDRKDGEFALGPTHEEVITDLVRREIRSYRELPKMFYQFGLKYRDEIRPRFGVMRAREFYMKDAYSFHATEEDAERYYKIVFDAYAKICERCGFKYRSVEAETGAIGGSFSHEFMVLADTGEEEIVSCKSCGYAANVERAEIAKSEERRAKSEELGQLKEVHTPNLRTVEEVGNFLKAPVEKFIKSLIYLADNQPLMVLIRGDHEVNETKLKKELACNELNLADATTIEKISSAPVGFAGPVGLAKSEEQRAKSIPIFADYSVENIVNAISGANKKDYHLMNINIGRDYQPKAIIDLRKIKPADPCPRCQSTLTFSRGIEVGHTFKLGTKYSKSMKATFLNHQGKEQYFVMGCYGIGVSRIVAAAIEQSHDENGIIWPVNLAPYQMIIIPVNYNDEKIRKTAEKIYEQLKNAGCEVLLDDREERAGVKFKDADLAGVPLRITVSEKNLTQNKVELKLRWEEKTSNILIDNLISEIKKFLT